MIKLRRLVRNIDRTHGDALSVREREVVRLAAEGFTNKAIARQLGISDGTVKLHLHSVYRKLGIKSRFALAALVHKRAF